MQVQELLNDALEEELENTREQLRAALAGQSEAGLNQRLQEELKQTQVELHTAQAEAKAALTGLAMQSARSAEMKAELLAAPRVHTALETATTLRSEAERLQQDDAAAAIQTKLLRVRAECDAKQAQLVEQALELHALHSELQAARIAEDDATEHTHELKLEIKAEEVEQEKLRAELQKTRDGLQAAAADAAKQVQALERELQRTRAELWASKATVEAAPEDRRVHDMQRSPTELQAVQRALMEAEAELDLQRHTVMDGKQEVINNTGLLTELQEQLDFAKLQCAEHVRQTLAKDDAITAFTGELERSRGQVQTLHRELHAARAVQDEQFRTRDEVHKLGRELQSARARHGEAAQVDAELRRTKQDLITFQGQATRFETRSNALETEVEHTGRKRLDVEHQLQSAQVDLIQVQKQLHASQQINADIESEKLQVSQEINADFEELKDELKRSQQQMHAAQWLRAEVEVETDEQVGTLKQQVNSYHQAAGDVLKSNQLLELEIQQLQYAAVMIQKENHDAKAEKEVAQTELQLCQLKLAAVQQESSESGMQLALFKGELESVQLQYSAKVALCDWACQTQQSQQQLKRQQSK